MILQGSSKIPFRTASHQRITYNTSRKPVWKDPWADTPFRESLKRGEQRVSHCLTYVHDLRLKHLSLARLAVGSHGDAGCWVPNHASLDWPVHGTSSSSTGDSHSCTLWCPFPRGHGGPRSATANHSCMQGRGNWEVQTLKTAQEQIPDLPT